MLFAQSIKATLAKKFAGASFSLDQQSPIVPIRHMKFDFDPRQIDYKFYMNAELASAYFASLSIFLTYGEDLVIDTARYHRNLIQDPLLKQRITSLIGQEALHSKLHEELNDAFLKVDLPVKLFRTWAGWVFDYGFNRLPQPMKLSLMAAIEHFTAVFAQYAMMHQDIFNHSLDEKTRALWLWHMLEESEHKDIAYDKDPNFIVYCKTWDELIRKAKLSLNKQKEDLQIQIKESKHEQLLTQYLNQVDFKN